MSTDRINTNEAMDEQMQQRKTDMNKTSANNNDDESLVDKIGDFVNDDMNKEFPLSGGEGQETV